MNKSTIPSTGQDITNMASQIKFLFIKYKSTIARESEHDEYATINSEMSKIWLDNKWKRKMKMMKQVNSKSKPSTH